MALRFDGYTDGADLWQYVIANFGTLCWGAIMLGCLVMVSSATAKAVFEEWGGAAFRGICRPSGVTSSGCPG